MRDKRLPAVNGALGLIILLLIVQMWLLTACLEAYLAGHDDAVVPGVVVSALLLASCAGLHLFIQRVDRPREKTLNE